MIIQTNEAIQIPPKFADIAPGNLFQWDARVWLKVNPDAAAPIGRTSHTGLNVTAVPFDPLTIVRIVTKIVLDVA
ncbi:hypothetical protein [Burkholderia phage vB_BglM_WTB]